MALGQAAVHLIRINSVKGEPGAVLGQERIWRPPLPGCLPAGGAGEPPERPPIPTAVRSHSYPPSITESPQVRQRASVELVSSHLLHRMPAVACFHRLAACGRGRRGAGAPYSAYSRARLPA